MGPGLWLRLLILPVFVKILCLHFTSVQGAQFARLGRHHRRRSRPLPDNWAFWAARRIGAFVYWVPLLRRRGCYWRSQLIFDILPRFGFPVVMHLGIPRGSATGDQGLAHVWVSLRGGVLGGKDDGPAHYLELASYRTDLTYD